VHLPGPSRWPFVVPIGLALLFMALVLPARNDAGDVIFPFNLPLLLVGLVVSLVAFVGWLRDAMKEWRTAEVGHGTAAPAALAWAAAHGVPHAIDGGPQAAVAALPSGMAAAKEPPVGVHLPGPSPWPFFAPIAIALIFFGLILSPALLIGGLLLAVVAAAGWLREASREWRSTESVGHAVPYTRDPVQAWPRRIVRVFAWVIALSVIVALLPLGLTWLGGLAPVGPSPTPLAVPARPEISASSSTSFEVRELVVPSGRDFELVFHNNEPGVPHNVDIAESAARTTLYHEGEIINGVASITYQVAALAEGDYYFLCRVHPNMNGTVLARPETPAGEPSPSP
jgi:plastocyanin